MKGYTAWAKCPGTCGEWVQGTKNGVPFLIGCPVNRYVEARVEIGPKVPREDGGVVANYDQQWDLPPGKTKTRQVLEGFAQEMELPPFRAKIQLESQLPIGKGMASSTADMVAALGAVSHALEIPWEEEKIAGLALKVEPTDPVMFGQITEFAHRDGGYIKQLGDVIEARLLMLDWGGVLDTETFNARGDLKEHYRSNEQTIKEALALFYEGMTKRDLEIIALASTISARCNQEINPKPNFDAFLSWVKDQGGLGLLTAHSGTLLAGIFPGDFSLQKQNYTLREARIRFQPERAEWLETCQGGIKGGKVDARGQSMGSQGAIWKAEFY